MEPMMRDLPSEDRPREKMLRLGVKSLSNDELLALFLRTGVKGKSAIMVGRDLLQRFGSLGALGQVDVGQLKKVHGLGLGKASQLVAAFELGRRVALENVVQVALDTPAKLYDAFAPQLMHLPQEKLCVVLLNARLCMEGMVEVSAGTVNETMAHPRDIMHPVISRNSYAFFVMHNHPSGDPSPSRNDIAFTTRVADASKLMQIRFLDHVIIGKPAEGRQGYFSFKEGGLL